MKRFIILALITAFCLSDYAQFKAFDLEESGYLRLIPSYMTKDGKQILYSCDNGFTVYDDNFHVIKENKALSNEISYKSRIIKYTRLVDPETKEFLSDWIVESDNTQDQTGGSEYFSIVVCSDENSCSFFPLNLTQTLFDEDEDFEFVRRRYEVIPITVKTKDYNNEQSKVRNKTRAPDDDFVNWMYENGAEEFEAFWDNDRQKSVYKMIKYERYGGLYCTGLEVVNLDGVVEQTLDGVKNSGYTGYHVNGDFFIKGYEEKVVYRLNSHKLPESNVRGVNYDLNRDGKVNVADHVKLSDFIMSPQ